MSELIINSAILISLIFLAIIFLKNKQDSKVNWAVFYSGIYIFSVLPIVNFLCVRLGFWKFNVDESTWQLPFNFYFLWIVFWGVLPVYFFKGKYFIFVLVAVFWLDVLLMPQLEKWGVISLSENWFLGELLLLVLVFIPSYFWAKISYSNKLVSVRALFQIVVMATVFLIGLPSIMESFGFIDEIKFKKTPYLFQILLMLVFPAIIAVLDLVTIGRGTPFPYDKTNDIVRSGVYGYIRNPIQWSFTLLFVPLSIYYSSWYLLFGSVVAVAYAFGVSDFQEYDDMEQRFGEKWLAYKSSVPKWFFQWKPKNYPKGTIYFDSECQQCNQLKKWFVQSNSVNLEVKIAKEYSGSILQVTYIDDQGNKFKSVEAIAKSLEHINLAFATLGWFMRFPVIKFVLQTIVDATTIGEEKKCEL